MQPLFDISIWTPHIATHDCIFMFKCQFCLTLKCFYLLPFAETEPQTDKKRERWHKTSYSTGGIKATPVLICSQAHSKLLLIVLCVTWTSSLIWVQSVPGFPGSLAQGCLSNTASLCWTAAHWTSQGPHVHKGMFGWIRYIATHTPLVCLFDSTNVIWHLNWVREVPVVHWAQPADGDPSRELFDYSGPEEAAETVGNSKRKWWFQQFLQTKASYFISFL